MSEVNQEAARFGAGSKRGVPAVERAIEVLKRLGSETDPAARTVTGVATALGIHKSSCSNILWTLEAAGLVEYAATSRSFQLGAELISLGAAASKNRDFVRAAEGPMRRLVQATGMTCVAFEQIASDEFVIVSKVESAREIKVTIDIGQHFHPATPGLARLVAAFEEPVAAARYLERWKARIFTPTTKTDAAEVGAEVERVREQGYAISRGEYYAGNTAVAAPVFSADDRTFRGLCLIAFNEEVAGSPLRGVGEAARAAADEISRSLGRAPREGAFRRP
jgi:DNA-binding IclR family transcriptional regulator